MIMDFSTYDPNARKMSRHLADALYAALTSNQREVSDYRSAVQVLTETAFLQALQVTYRLSETQVRLVRHLMGEYGLDDQLDGTTATGLEGIVEFVVINPAYPY